MNAIATLPDGAFSGLRNLTSLYVRARMRFFLALTHSTHHTHTHAGTSPTTC
jgi:hypothetical protein